MGSRSGAGVVEERNIDDILSIRNSDNTVRTNFAGGTTRSAKEPPDTKGNPGNKNRQGS
jgi:hypothetical protein